MNTFGQFFRLSDFGETHGECIGGVIDGCPVGIFIDEGFIAAELTRRKPSEHFASTQRKESDHFKLLSGIKNGYTTGMPIGFIISNEDVIVDSENERVIKPSHASFVYKMKYGSEDNSGCGRASARLTACSVLAGAIAKLFLKKYNIVITATEEFPQKEIKSLDTQDTIGAIISCKIQNLPVGLGEPLYDKFHARLAYAMLSIPAARGFELGEGFANAKMRGSQYNDLQNNDFSYQTNHDAGVQAGITNGGEVRFRVAFKPVPSIQKPQQTIDFQGNFVLYQAGFRNDRCVSPRVLPVVEAMAAMVVADYCMITFRK